jgi:threonine/homoserine/homoserine lactone efflux protein
MSIILRGFLIGISIAAPVGPIGVLCIRRTLAEGRLSGLVSGLGAASADAIYGMIAGFGLTFISGFLVTQQIWLRVIGGLFLCYLGIRTFRSHPSGDAVQTQSKGLAGNYLSIFFLTLTNPMTVLSFTAVFAGLGLVGNTGNYLSASLLVLGVFSGSAFWWLVLSLGVGFFRERVTHRWMSLINRFSGVVIITFGIMSLISLFQLNSPL